MFDKSSQDANRCLTVGGWVVGLVVDDLCALLL